MFDQSPYWGLRTAFPSVLRPLFISAKLGRWVYRVKTPKTCQSWARAGKCGGRWATGEREVAAKGVLPMCLFYLHHVSSLPLPQFPYPPFLSPSLKPSHVSVSDQLLPSTACSLCLTYPLFPQPPKLKERRGGREERRGETGQVEERMRSAMLRSRWRGQWGMGLG